MTNPITLASGVHLHIIPTDKFTTNILCILIRHPLKLEEVTSTALLPPLLARGSQKYPTVRDIRLAEEAMQGSVFDAQIIKKGEQQIMQFFLEYVDGDIHFKNQGIDFLHEIINRPLTGCPYIKGEAENLKNRIKGRINNKSEYAKLKCFEAMCSNEPFGIYGDGYAEDLDAITPDGLLEHYNDLLMTAPIDFIALGKWDAKWLEDEIQRKFGPFSGKREDIPAPSLFPARPERQIINLDYGTTQGNLCIGLRGQISPLGMDFIHFQLANEILGSGPNAKLFANVREKESLCYAIFSTIFRFKSLMCILAGTEPNKMGHVLELAEREVEAIKRGNISKDDMHSAKKSLCKRWRAMQDNAGACVDFYASQYLLGDRRTVDELLVQVESATAEGVAQAMSGLGIDTVVMMS